MSSPDFNIFHIRNTMSYNPDGSYVSSGYIFTVSTNGRQLWTNSLNLNNLSASTLTLQSTLSLDNLVVGSTLSALSLLASSLRVSTLLTSSLTATSITSGNIGFSTLTGSSFVVTSGSLSSLTTSTLLTGNMNFSTLIGSSITSNAIGVSSFVGSSLTTTSIITSALGVSTFSGSSLNSNSIITSVLDASTLTGSSLTTTSITTSALNVSTLVGSSLSATSVVTSALDVSTLTGSTVIASSLTFSAADFSTMIGSSMYLNMASISSLTISSIIAPNGFGSTGPTGAGGSGGSGDGTGYTGPTGIAGGSGETAVVSRRPTVTQSITSGSNQLVIWDTLDTSQSIGNTSLVYSSGIFTNNSAVAVPLAIDYTLILNTTGSGSSYIGLNGAANAYGVLINDNNIFTNSFTILLTPGSSFGIYYNDNGTPIIQTTSRITISRLIVGQEGPTGPQGGNTLVSVYSAYPSATQNISASTETLLLWNTQDLSQSQGLTGLTYLNGVFTNNNAGTLPLLVEYQVLLNTTAGGATYVKLNGTTNYGSMLTDNNSFTNSFVVLLPAGQTLGVYYMDNTACVVQTSSRVSVTLLVSGLGQTGAAGYVGADGATGPTGYLGLDGPTGPTGIQGPVGQVASLYVKPTVTQNFSAGVNTLTLWGDTIAGQTAGAIGLSYSSGLFTNTTASQIPLLVEYSIITDVTGTGSSYVFAGGVSYGPVIHTTNVSSNSFTVFLSPGADVGVYYVDNSSCVLQTTSRLRLSILTAGQAGPTGATGMTGPVGQVATLSAQPSVTQSIVASTVTAIRWASVDTSQSANQTGLLYSAGTGLFTNTTLSWVPVLVEYSIYLDTSLGGYSFVGVNGSTSTFGGMYNDSNWFSNSYTVLVPAGQTVGVYYTDNTGCVVQTDSRIRLTVLTAGPMGATGPTGITGPTGPSGPTGLQGLTGPTGLMIWQLNGSNVSYSAGNVGVGVTNPNAPLQVFGAPGANGVQSVTSNTTLSSTSGSYDILQRWFESTGNTNFIDLSWLRTSAGADWNSAGQRFQSKTDATWQSYIQFNGTDNGHGLSFGTGSSTVSPSSVTERMRIDSAGNVGIGTTTLLHKLQVSGNCFFGDGNSVYVGVDALNSYRMYHTGNDSYLDYGTGKLAIRHNNESGIDATPMEILSTGNVAIGHLGGSLGVGTGNPLAPLHVYGTNGMALSNTQTVNTTQTSLIGFNYGGGTGSGTRDGFRIISLAVNRDNGAGPFFDYGAQSHLIFQRKTNNLFSGGANDMTYTEVMRIHGASGNVGIGTNNPDFGKLQVSGGKAVFGYISSSKKGIFIDNEDSYGGYPCIQGVTSGWAADNIQINPAGGNVGIGTTNPDQKLHVYSGNVHTSSPYYDTLTSQVYAVNFEGSDCTNGNGGVTVYAPSMRMKAPDLTWGGGVRVYGAEMLLNGGWSPSAATNHGEVIFKTQNAERFRISGNGNVGIGTADPDHLLMVTRYSTYIAPVLTLDAGTPGAVSNGAPRGIGAPLLGIGSKSFTSGGVAGDYYGIGFGYNGGTANNYYPAEIGLYVQNSGGSEYGDLVFSTRPNTTNIVATERMRISSTGFVGIGSTNPTQALDVVGTINVTGNIVVGGTVLPVTSGSVWATSGTNILYSAGNVGVLRRRVAFSSTPEDPNHSIYNNYLNLDGEGSWDGFKMNVFNGLNVRVGNASGATPTSALYVDSTGNVGIGTATVDQKLHVYGSMRLDARAAYYSTQTANTTYAAGTWYTILPVGNLNVGGIYLVSFVWNTSIGIEPWGLGGSFLFNSGAGTNDVYGGQPGMTGAAIPTSYHAINNNVSDWQIYVRAYANGYMTSPGIQFKINAALSSGSWTIKAHLISY